MLQYCFCFMFCFFGPETCGILVLQTGVESTPPALEGEVLTTGLPGKSLSRLLLTPLNLAAPEPAVWWAEFCFHCPCARLCPTLCNPMDCSKNTRVGCHFHLQGIFPTQGLNPVLPHCIQILYHMGLQERGWINFYQMLLELCCPRTNVYVNLSANVFI